MEMNLLRGGFELCSSLLARFSSGEVMLEIRCQSKGLEWGSMQLRFQAKVRSKVPQLH